MIVVEEECHLEGVEGVCARNHVNASLSRVRVCVWVFFSCGFYKLEYNCTVCLT